MPYKSALVVLTLAGALAGVLTFAACNSDDAAPSDACTGDCSISLTWVAKPGAVQCPLGLRCRYEVAADGGGARDIASYTWTFGDAGVPGADADIEYAYPTAGIYPVNVTAKLKDGSTGGSLDSVEHVCLSDPEADCEPGGDECCSGTCTVNRRCR